MYTKHVNIVAVGIFTSCPVTCWGISIYLSNRVYNTTKTENSCPNGLKLFGILEGYKIFQMDDIRFLD